MIVGVSVRPPALEEFSDVGEDFYPEFEDPTAATGVRVASYNPDAAKTDLFEVRRNADGGWTIPSVYDYPADGEDRLAKTASSIIGIKRAGYIPASPEDFGRYGVIDPLDPAADTEGRGSRITLLEGDDTLVDYIIGKAKDDEATGEKLYYVRKPDENRVYQASLDIDLSTKFSDWIEPDLLQIGVSDIREIRIDRYQIDEETMRVNEGDKVLLTRDSPTDDWTAADLKEGETVNTSAVSGTVTALDDLEIVGVRPKPEMLTASLKKDTSQRFSQFDQIQMQADLERRGFFLDPQGGLVSNEGELAVGTREGLLYVLRFGELFTGSEAVLIGAESEPETDDTEDAADETAEGDGEESSEDDGTVRGRYVFITVQTAEDLLEQPGEPPVKPEPPAEDEATEADEQAESEGEDAEADESSDDAGAEPTAEEKAAAAKAEYDAAVKQYEADLADYERKKERYAEAVKKAEERAEELQERFADWYYVISADTFDRLSLSRDALIEPAPAELPTADAAGEEMTEGADLDPPALPTSDGVKEMVEELTEGKDAGEGSDKGEAKAGPTEADPAAVEAKPSPDAETKSEPAGDPPSEEPSSEEPPAEAPPSEESP